jgi:hypothetical protein
MNQESVARSSHDLFLFIELLETCIKHGKTNVARSSRSLFDLHRIARGM